MKLLDQKISLVPPDLNQQNYLGAQCAIRPYRNGGIRIQQQYINNKTIIHNYGHGGAGLSLAYGSAFISSQIIKRLQLHSSKKIAVIGSGIIGLFTALCLRQEGNDVTIYSQDIPTDKKQVYQKMYPIASEVAGGFWMPCGVDKKDQVNYQVLARISFDYYSQCIRLGKYKGLSLIPVYFFDQEQFKSQINFIPQGLIKDVKQVEVQFGNGKYHDAYKFTSILMQAKVFLKQLYDQAQQRFIKFQKRKFNSKQQILKVPENIIYNCTGYSSKYLFQDHNLVPYKGHLLIFKSTQSVNYYLSGKINGKRVTVYPLNSKIIGIGISKQQDQSKQKNPLVIEQLKKNSRQYFHSMTTKPKL